MGGFFWGGVRLHPLMGFARSFRFTQELQRRGTIDLASERDIASLVKGDSSL